MWQEAVIAMKRINCCAVIMEFSTSLSSYNICVCILACDANCMECTVPTKCTSGKCNTEYRYKSSDQTCEGMYTCVHPRTRRPFSRRPTARLLIESQILTTSGGGGVPRHCGGGGGGGGVPRPYFPAGPSGPSFPAGPSGPSFPPGPFGGGVVPRPSFAGPSSSPGPPSQVVPAVWALLPSWSLLEGGVPCDLSHNALDVTCLLPSALWETSHVTPPKS